MGASCRNAHRQPSGGFHKQHMVGTLEYLAPEILMAGAARRASDVYSFAVTVNELATQTQPYTDRKRSVALAHTVLDYSYNNDDLAKAIASEGLRPTLPAPHESGGIAGVIERAWSHDPCARPSIDAILTEIDQLARDRLGGKGGGTDTLHPVWYEPRGGAGPVEEYVKNALRANRNEEEASTARREEEEANERLTTEPGHSVPHALAQLKQPYCRPSPHIAPGRRRGQDRFEDRHLVASPSEQLPSTHVLGIFDGHGGWECAEYVKEHLEPVLADQAAKTCSLTMALHASFEELESGFAHVVAQTDSYQAGKSPGTTALVVVHHAYGLTIASAGDCRAVACRDGAAVELNSTQLASDLHERMRVERNGGYVMKTDSWRVGSVGLQVTRSIGDYEAKEEGVTAEPVVSHVQLSENDRYVLLASDGVWDVMTAQQAIDLCESTVKDTDMMARRVADAVEDNGGFDNATVIVAALQPLSSVQRVY
jgi:serine/threonine protein phosphatase PrpC